MSTLDLILTIATTAHNNYRIELSMFSRFLARKKEAPEEPETKEERKLRMLVNTAATIDKKIAYFDKKWELRLECSIRADAVQAKRDKYYDAAKKARSLGRNAETIRFLRGVKQCDEDYQRLSVPFALFIHRRI